MKTFEGETNSGDPSSQKNDIYYLKVDKWDFPKHFSFKDLVLQNNWQGENPCTGDYICRASEGTKSIVNHSIFMFEIIATEGIFNTNIYIGFTPKNTKYFIDPTNFLLSL